MTIPDGQNWHRVKNKSTRRKSGEKIAIENNIRKAKSNSEVLKNIGRGRGWVGGVGCGWGGVWGVRSGRGGGGWALHLSYFPRNSSSSFMYHENPVYAKICTHIIQQLGIFQDIIQLGIFYVLLVKQLGVFQDVLPVQQLGIFQDVVQQLGILQDVLPAQQLGVWYASVKNLGIFQVLRHLGIFQDVVRHLGILQVVVPHLGIFQDVAQQLGIFQDVVQQLGIFQYVLPV